MQQNVLQVNPSDNVLVALKDLKKGESVIWQDNEFELLEDVPGKHKIFTDALNAGDNVTMYGVTVGIVQHNVQRGSRMTVENTVHATDKFEYKGTSFHWNPPDAGKFKHQTFKGYHRNDGRVGTANYWLFMPTVFCENRNLDIIKEALQSELGYAVSEKYKVFTSKLVYAYINGADINNINFSPEHPSLPDKRVFKK